MSALSKDDFVARLREEGEKRYHDHHPFHVRMHAGELSRTQIQAWVLNRYYYQTRIPIKDAIILSKSDDPAFRRSWMQRIVDHDGKSEGEGGLAQWQRLAAGVGLDVEEVKSLSRVLPGVRFACDAYVQLVRERPLVEAVASSLTEFFSPDIMTRRIAAWETHYPWVDGATLAYFRGRVTRARDDSRQAIDYVLAHATGREQQERCIEALITKCHILWALLDAVSKEFPA
ncbi:pyrroloquinoline-quinone synthase PqqC [Pendulispora brunnea]|uniref:Pyrroloquinoline-quinone synthase n=1 Tax=Pendulispora brunnea TaxID=2905690 RepID=A0ABZ2KCK0_9BACT